MRFDWDDRKAESNRVKHGVRFEDAITAFDDPYALIEKDEEHSTSHELRETLIGEAVTGILVVIFTVRKSGTVYRIISARKATRREKQIYEETKRIPL